MEKEREREMEKEREREMARVKWDDREMEYQTFCVLN